MYIIKSLKFYRNIYIYMYINMFKYMYIGHIYINNECMDVFHWKWMIALSVCWLAVSSSIVSSIEVLEPGCTRPQEPIASPIPW